MRDLEKSQTWDLAELPEDKKAVGCKWVYIMKYQYDESIKRHNVRLVV